MAPRVVRPANQTDAAAIARIKIDAWRATYDGIIAKSELDALNLDHLTERWQRIIVETSGEIWVAEDKQEVVGFCSAQRSRDTDIAERAGEVTALYVAPEHWRAGFGRMLLAASLEYARRIGFELMTLWVAEENSHAIAFYRSLAFEADGEAKSPKLGGQPLPQVRLSRSVD